MKKILILIALVTLTGYHSLAQKKSTDPSLSARNYKHSDKAEYAKKHNLDKNVTLNETQTVQNDYYKHNNKKATTKKMGMTVKNKPHPNYKHQ